MKRNIIIIGGGIVGLATALKIKEKNPSYSLMIIDKEGDVSRHQTGHNSGVIHSGIYYKPGSLKAINCRNGYRQLLEFCESNQIEYEICGKIIVAVDKDETARLNNLFERGKQNGLGSIKKLKKDELKEYEPHVNGVAGLHVPQTGIIDFMEVSLKMKEILKNQDVEFRFEEKVNKLIKISGGYQVETLKDVYQASLVINCAGLYSDKVARLTTSDINVRIIPFRGEYFKIRKEKSNLVKNLIYPVPDPAFPFLGVHFTRMIHGGIEAGPNAVLAFAREGYKKSDINIREFAETLLWPGFRKVAGKYWKTGFDEMYRSFSKGAFTKALQKLIPEINENDLETGGSGVRAQACDRDGGLVDDFLIFENENVINVCNAPSPAATSCLSIGEKIAERAIIYI